MNKIFGIALLLLSSASHAVLVDFQDVTSGACAYSGTSVTSQGFNFTGNPSDPALYVCNAFVNGNNTSAALIDANSLSAITMTAADSSLFSLESFFAGSRTEDYNTSQVSSYYGLSTGIQVVGTQFGGATVTETINFDFLNFDLFTLANSFTNLVSATFTSIGGGNTEFLIDDITVNSVSVPAPSIFSLLGLGLIGIMMRRKKH